jgi:hypothetical protein
VGRHSQLEALAIVIGGPVDVGQQAEVFAKLVTEPLGDGAFPASGERDPKSSTP